MKTCIKCKIEKKLIEFCKDKSRKDELHPQCKGCKKQYDIKNTDKRKQYNKEYNIKNVDKKRKYDKQRYIDNIEHITQYIKQWCQTPQGKLSKSASRHKRRASIRNNTPVGKHFTADDITLKLKLQKYKCVYCKKSIKDYFEPDHFIPLVKGGSNEAWNIQLLCKDCNGTGGKGSKLSHEFAQLHGKLF